MPTTSVFNFYALKEKRLMSQIVPYNITLKIKAFDLFQLLKICRYVKKMCELLVSGSQSTVFLPVKKKHFTVCRSPHVHKKSRTQLLYKRHKVVLTFKVPNFESYSLLLFFFKTSVLPGVEFELCVSENTFIL